MHKEGNMNSFITKPGIWVCLISLLILSNGCFKNLTQKYQLYANDFENADLKGMEVYDSSGHVKNPFSDVNGSKVLGRFNNNTILFGFVGIPSHNIIQIEFDLNIHDKWVGNYKGTNKEVDIWQMSVDNNPTLITTFSNDPSYFQSFPNFYNPGVTSPVPAKTDATIIDGKGVCSLQGVIGGTSTYRIVKFIQHWGRNLTITCNDALQPYNSICSKSWSIDNVTITAIKY
jgi:hypothetical protein